MKPTTVGELQIALESLDRLTQQRFEGQEKAVNAALAAAEKAVSAALAAAKVAVNKAEAASEKRFESVNEFRSQLKDQQATLMPRSEADVRFNAINEAIQRMSARQSETAGKSDGASASWGTAIVIVSLLIAAGSVIVNLLK